MAFLASIKKRTDLRAKGVAKEADDRDPTAITDTPWIGTFYFSWIGTFYRSHFN